MALELLENFNEELLRVVILFKNTFIVQQAR